MRFLSVLTWLLARTAHRTECFILCVPKSTPRIGVWRSQSRGLLVSGVCETRPRSFPWILLVNCFFCRTNLCLGFRSEVVRLVSGMPAMSRDCSSIRFDFTMICVHFFFFIHFIWDREWLFLFSLTKVCFNRTRWVSVPMNITYF